MHTKEFSSRALEIEVDAQDFFEALFFEILDELRRGASVEALFSSCQAHFVDSVASSDKSFPVIDFDIDFDDAYFSYCGVSYGVTRTYVEMQGSLCIADMQTLVCKVVRYALGKE